MAFENVSPTPAISIASGHVLGGKLLEHRLQHPGLCGAEDLRCDPTVAVDDDCRRRIRRQSWVELQGDRRRIVHDRRVAHCVGADERARRGIVIADVDTEEFDTLGMYGVVHGVQLRLLGATWSAPRRPDVEDDNTTGEVAHIDDATGEALPRDRRRSDAVVWV